jgi:hypothetical protein
LSQVHVDNGEKGDSGGDVFGGAADLRRDGKPYGRMELMVHAVDELVPPARPPVWQAASVTGAERLEHTFDRALRIGDRAA